MDLKLKNKQSTLSSPSLDLISSEAQKQAETSPASCMAEAPVLLKADAEKSIQAYEAKTIQALEGETHLEEDKQLIHHLIQKPTELHFYWTFGRDVEHYPVRIGGEKYHERFTRYLNKLLDVSPAFLKVVLALDDLTLQANQSWIEALQAKYPNRLELRLIGDAQAKLEKAFPEYSESIQQVFANASQGNPVIASDIYRLLCMVEPEKALSTLFTYCDVDTFVYGCDTLPFELKKRPQLDFKTRSLTFVEETVEIPGHSNLMKALFQEPSCDSTKLRRGFFQDRDPNESFFLCRPMEGGTGYKNNDIVKFKVQDVQSYSDFSDNILSYLEKHLNDEAKPLNILNYFTQLHSAIKACEGTANEALQALFDAYLKEFNTVAIQPAEVIAVTGPGLLDRMLECSPLGVVHPRVASWEWHGTELLGKTLEGPLGAFSSRNPTYEKTQESFDLYASRLNDALYAKKFGEAHPFYAALKDYLLQHFPYNEESFEALVKEEYERNRNMSTETFPSYEKWRPLFLDKIKKKAPGNRPVEPDDSYYARLLSIFNTLDISVDIKPS